MSTQNEFDDIDKIDYEVIKEIKVLKRGDHLAVEGAFVGIDYHHHGIFLGFEKGVAEFGKYCSGGNIRVVDLFKFANYGKRTMIRIIYNDGTCNSPEVCAQTAENYVKNPESFGKFGFLTNNCEHFATKCKTGRAASKQVIAKLEKFVPKGMLVEELLSSSSCSSSSS